MRDTPNDLKVLLLCGLFAFVAENVALIAVGSSQHWLAHPEAHKTEQTNFIEAEVVQMPEEKMLTEEKKVAVPAHAEAVLSKVPNQGRKAKPNENPLPQENITQTRAALPPNHGPIALSSPAPKIPSYLQTEDIHASVVIDFYVTAKGDVNPKLVASSGNDELDAIALKATKQWRFSPAEKDHQAIDSKVRLRIQFDVH